MNLATHMLVSYPPKGKELTMNHQRAILIATTVIAAQ